MKRFLLLVVLVGILHTPLGAEQSLAERFSGEWKLTHKEIGAIDTQLSRLPTISVEDLDSKRGYAGFFGSSNAVGDRSVDFKIRVLWSRPELIDLIAIVPARDYAPSGIQPNHGFPDDFSVHLLAPDGSATQTGPTFTATSENPVHRGHPWVIQPEEPMEAIGVEIKVTRLRPVAPGGPDMHLLALAEVFCFSDLRNVAAGAAVQIEGDHLPGTSIYWSQDHLTDGSTPLGLPEVPELSLDWRGIGWTSLARETADASISIVVDLGQERHFDGIRLFPALRPSYEDFPGFGTPQGYKIQIAQSNRADSYTTLLDLTQVEAAAASHNPVTHRFLETKGRFIRLETTRLWKPFAHYPAFLALSEMEILQGESNIAVGSEVITEEQQKPILAQGDWVWTPSALTDGHGPQGLLVPTREWLLSLDLRFQLEARRNELVNQLEVIEQRWHRGAIALLSVAAISALGIASILPFRYRLREKRKIQGIRERIAGDLHDDVGSNLGSIQMLSDLARQQSSRGEELELIHQVAAETVTSVRDIVWLLHPQDRTRVPTIEHLRESASILLEGIDWKLDADFPDWVLGEEDRRHLVLFFREALHNLSRHAKASEAKIQLSEDDGEFVMSIQDNGCGIDPNKMNKPSALRALHQRASKLGGAATIQSSAAGGTRIELRFAPRSAGSATHPSRP